MQLIRWLCVGALAACQSPPPSPGSGGSGAGSGSGSASPRPPIQVQKYALPATQVMEAPPIALPRQERFRLLDPGQGARTVLRYAPAVETIEYQTETRLVSRALDHGQFGKPVELPAIRDGFAITPSSGLIELRALAGESAASKDEAARAAAEQYLASWRARLQNRRATVGLDARGQLGAITFNDDPTGARSAPSRDELAQRLLAVIVPLPEDPVGRGARWEVVTVLRQGPAYVRQTATYTLVERGPHSWKLHVELLRVAEEQRVSDPALPPGTVVDLVAMFRRLEGDIEIDPARPLIASGRLTIESRLHANIKPAGQPAVEKFLEDTGEIAFSTRRP
ncbi:MAG: hypothetical protein ACTHU0_00255 [Kofleriaceae bacterium]